jgi:hypothetical protein
LGGPVSTEEAKASLFLRRGSLAALAGAMAGLAVPVALVFLAAGHIAGLTSTSSWLLASESLLAVGGALLLVLALFLYRRAFGHLRHVDRRLAPVAALCLVGSAGALALVVVGAYVAGGSSSIAGCLSGHPTHALGCLRSRAPAAGLLAVAGFWLVWLGAAAVAAGLVLAGRHFGRRAVVAGGCSYAALAALLVVPFAGLVVPLPATPLALAAAPFLAVAGAVLVYLGARTALVRRG